MRYYPQYINRGFLANNTIPLKRNNFVANGIINTPEIIRDDFSKMTWSRSLTVMDSFTTHVVMTVSRQSAGGGMYSSTSGGGGHSSRSSGSSTNTSPIQTISRQSAGGGMYLSTSPSGAAGGGGNSSTYPAVVQYGNFLDQQLSSATTCATTCGDDRDFQSPGKRRFVKRSTDY